VASTLIIHVFCKRGDFYPMTTAIFSQAVVFFAFFGLSIAMLRLSAGFQAGGRTAGIGAVRLSAPAPSADAKFDTAPPAPYHDQLRDPALKSAGIWSILYENFRPYLTKFITRARNGDFGLSLFLSLKNSLLLIIYDALAEKAKISGGDRQGGVCWVC
jgi:hypothetical protein